MSDELRVTVVATGLGGERKAQFGIVDNGFKKASGSDIATKSSNATSTTPGVFVPNFANQTSEEVSSAASVPAEATPEKETPEAGKAEQGDYFDIPAFLRKQAD